MLNYGIFFYNSFRQISYGLYISIALKAAMDTDQFLFFQSLKQVACQNVSSLSEGRAYKWAFYMPNPFALKEISNMMSKNKVNVQYVEE